MEDTKRCVECAMDLRMEAKRCPHCRASQPGGEPLHRGRAERLLAGVCAALAHQLRVDTVLVRVAFVVALAVTGGTAVGIYLLLWVLTPTAPGAQPPAQRAMDWLSSLFRSTPPGNPVPVQSEPTSGSEPRV